ncbi:DUF559 domain-containing protein [Actinomycetospora sp. TBRC 11914]|uniref:DUF559 domain-containing protein n=1 Tax=Actinomycetospora sp. TBRC 11914 TaxID=2729387 RepID=UPI00145F644E|nr:DUF559 domain-containing protein [Actinomycetospora sp. TBRC 11914]NMO88898.1 DUF559 domain-containing protein [Actinomycetospora sp. TBRC 11914]
MGVDASTTRPFRGSEAVARGEVTWGRLAGPAFRPLLTDVYVGSLAQVDTATWVRAVALWGRGTGVVSGPLAALAFGAECPWDDERELVMPTSRRPTSAEVAVRRDRLLPDEVCTRYGVRVTSPARTAFDLARRAPLVEAVAAVDSIAYRCRLTPDHLLAVAAAHPAARGSVQVRRVAELMDGRAMSLMETRARLGFVLRGVPAPIPQYEVRVADGGTRWLDLGWPEVPEGRRKVGVEFDGPEHRTITGQNRDHLRDADLDDLGWEIVRIGAAQVLDERLADALAARILRKVT